VFVLVAAACDRSSTGGQGADDEQASAVESANDAPDRDQTRSGPTSNGHYVVEVVPEPNPIPFQELFELTVRVWQSDRRAEPAESVALDQVRARMPAHDHGMKTAPEIREQKPGEFVVEGMRFHMRGSGEDGRWVLELVLNGDQGIDEASFEYQCCVSQ